MGECKTPGCPNPTVRITAAGRPPEFCPPCRAERGNAARDLRTAERNGAAAVVRGMRPARGFADTELSRVQRLAIALSATDDLEEAAGIAQLKLSKAKLRALEARARAEHPDLVAGRLAGLASLASQTIALLSLRLRDCAGELLVTQVAAALKQAADVSERLLGGVAPTFSTINVTLDLRDDESQTE